MTTLAGRMQTILTSESISDVDPAHFDRRHDNRLVDSDRPLYGQGHDSSFRPPAWLWWFEDRLDTGRKTGSSIRLP